MLFALAEAATRQASRRAIRSARSSPLLAMAGFGVAVGVVWFGPGLGRRFGAAQAEFLSIDSLPLALIVAVLGIAAGAMTDPMARSLAIRNQAVRAAPVARWVLSAASATPLVIITGLTLAVLLPTLHAAAGAGVAVTSLLAAALVTTGLFGAGVAGCVRAAWLLDARRFVAAVAVLLAGWGGISVLAGSWLGLVGLIASNLVGEGLVVSMFGQVIVGSAGFLAWVLASGAESRLRSSRTMHLPPTAIGALAVASSFSVFRRRDVRSHAWVGLLSTAAAVLLAAAVLDVEAALTVTLAGPLAVLAAYGPGLASGAVRSDASWLVNVAPLPHSKVNAAIAATAASLTVAALVVTLIPLAIAVGALPVVLSELHLLVLSAVAGSVVASRLNPWSITGTAAPLVGVLVAGVVGVTARWAVSRLFPVPGLTQIGVALLLAVLAVAAAAVVPTKAVR